MTDKGIEWSLRRARSSEAKRQRRRVVYAGFIGNALEWYDFAVYGFLASYIARTFFPEEDAVAGTLAAFTVFAIGYVVRPLGGVLIGHIGDRRGRRIALVVSISIMSVSTFLVGVLPGYDTLGVAAPILLTVIRITQGISAGGDSSSSIVLLVEKANQKHRGLYGSLITIGDMSGILLGSATPFIVSSVVSAEAMESWAWRVPFLMGSVIGVAGYFLRRNLAESASTQKAQSPLVEAITKHRLVILKLIGLNAVNAVFFNILFVYSVSWLQSVDEIAPETALEINTINMVLIVPVAVLSGLLSDHIGRKPLQIISATGLIVFAWPLLWMMHHHNPTVAFLGQLGFVPIVALYFGPLAAATVEAMPRSIRCTGVALSFNLSIGFFGGTAPAAAAWLVARTGYALAPAFYVIVATSIGLVAVLTMKDRYRETLSD